jgi:hypothetical protein
MDFSTTERIAAPREQVVAALADPDYYTYLATTVTSIKPPELLGATMGDTEVLLKVRYAFAGELSGAAKMAIDASKLTWVIDTRLDLASYVATLDLIPDHYADLVSCDAGLSFETDGDETVEVFDGSLSVKIPLFGQSAERVIVDGLLRHLAAEAVAVASFVRGDRAPAAG